MDETFKMQSKAFRVKYVHKQLKQETIKHGFRYCIMPEPSFFATGDKKTWALGTMQIILDK